MESPEPPTSAPKQKRPSSMACDNCRRRKIRCSREQPCRKCTDVALPCAYTSTPRRKGPKGQSAHVLNFLRGLGSEVPPSGLSHHQNNPFPAASTTTPETAPNLHSNDPENVGPFPPTPSLAFSQSSHSSTEQSQSPLGLATSPGGPAPRKGRISSTVLEAHVGLFMQHMYLIMPIVDSELMSDCANPEVLHPQRYAHLVALSAATHLQLNLDIGEYESSGDNLISGQNLINEAVRALGEYDTLEHPHLDTCLTMFFLFCAYGNLAKANYAWHYLSQTISFLQILKMDREESYAGFPPADAEIRRRVYWLIFVTERLVGEEEFALSPEVFPELTYMSIEHMPFKLVEPSFSVVVSANRLS